MGITNNVIAKKATIADKSSSGTRGDTRRIGRRTGSVTFVAVVRRRCQPVPGVSRNQLKTPAHDEQHAEQIQPDNHHSGHVVPSFRIGVRVTQQGPRGPVTTRSSCRAFDAR